MFPNSEKDIVALGNYLADEPPLFTHSIVPEFDPEAFAAVVKVVEEELKTVQEFDLNLAVGEFLTANRLEELEGKALSIRDDATMMAPEVAVSVGTAIWILLQTKVKIQVKKDGEKTGWSVEIDKPKIAMEPLLKLVKFLQGLFP